MKKKIEVQRNFKKNQILEKSQNSESLYRLNPKVSISSVFVINDLL